MIEKGVILADSTINTARWRYVIKLKKKYDEETRKIKSKAIGNVDAEAEFMRKKWY